MLKARHRRVTPSRMKHAKGYTWLQNRERKGLYYRKQLTDRASAVLSAIGIERNPDVG